jgi:predicted RNA-binding protein with PIN domain
VSGAPPLTVLVDARNVLRSRWPNIPEGKLVDLCLDWAAANDARAVVVFDRSAPGAFVGEREFSPHGLLVGTGAQSADDWLAHAAAELRARKQRFWLVTSDRALRERAGDGAEEVVGGGTFAGTLGRGASGRR